MHPRTCRLQTVPGARRRAPGTGPGPHPRVTDRHLYTREYNIIVRRLHVGLPDPLSYPLLLRYELDQDIIIFLVLLSPTPTPLFTTDLRH